MFQNTDIVATMVATRINAALGLGLLTTTIVSACGPDPAKLRFLTREVSPDGRREAIYAEDMSGGATVGTAEEVYVVRRGGFPHLGDRVLSEEGVCNLNVHWLGDNVLEVGYFARAAKVRHSGAADALSVRVR